MINSVCEIKKGKESGTGIFCKLLYYNKNNEKKFMNTLITNNHVIGENDLYRRKEIFFAWNNKSKEKSLDLDNSRIKFTNKNLDVTIIELKEEDKINCDFLEIDPLIEKEKKNLKHYLDYKPIYIIHYPKNLDGNKSVFSSFGILNKINKSEINYFCSTDNGSSGSPILSLNKNQILGLHKGAHKRFNYNIGVLMKDIIDEFSKYLINNRKLNKSKNYQLENNIRQKSINKKFKKGNNIKDNKIYNFNFEFKTKNENTFNNKNISHYIDSNNNFDIKKNNRTINNNNYFNYKNNEKNR